jgi:hypothetical protein
LTGLLRLAAQSTTTDPVFGSYAVGGWDSDHAATWGQAAFDAAALIKERVNASWPDVLLVHLGTNDLTWFGGAPRARETRFDG